MLAGSHRTAAMTAPTSITPAASSALVRDWWAATVYSATSRATSPRSGKPSSHWAKPMALAARNTPVGQTRRAAITAISAACTRPARRLAKSDCASQTVHTARSTAAASASMASGCACAIRRPWPNRLRVISSGGCSPGGSSVVVPNVHPSRSLTGSVPPARVSGRPRVRHRRWSHGFAWVVVRPEDEAGRGDFVLRAIPRAYWHRIGSGHRRDAGRGRCLLTCHHCSTVRFAWRGWISRRATASRRECR